MMPPRPRQGALSCFVSKCHEKYGPCMGGCSNRFTWPKTKQGKSKTIFSIRIDTEFDNPRFGLRQMAGAWRIPDADEMHNQAVQRSVM